MREGSYLNHVVAVVANEEAARTQGRHTCGARSGERVQHANGILQPTTEAGACEFKRG